MTRKPIESPSIFSLSLGYSYGGVKVTERAPRPPHAFVKSTGSIRRFGAPMRNPPAPADFMPDPTCRVCRMYPKHPNHDLTSNHDPGDEDRT